MSSAIRDGGPRMSPIDTSLADGTASIKKDAACNAHMTEWLNLGELCKEGMKCCPYGKISEANSVFNGIMEKLEALNAEYSRRGYKSDTVLEGFKGSVIDKAAELGGMLVSNLAARTLTPSEDVSFVLEDGVRADDVIAAFKPQIEDAASTENDKWTTEKLARDLKKGGSTRMLADTKMLKLELARKLLADMKDKVSRFEGRSKLEPATIKELDKIKDRFEDWHGTVLSILNDVSVRSLSAGAR
jgi:hypothetical protein